MLVQTLSLLPLNPLLRPRYLQLFLPTIRKSLVHQPNSPEKQPVQIKVSLFLMRRECLSLRILLRPLRSLAAVPPSPRFAE